MSQGIYTSNFQEQNKGVCPNCGYCPHCGRSNSPQFIPYNPYVPPYYPYIVYSETPNITWTSGGSASTYQVGQAIC